MVNQGSAEFCNFDGTGCYNAKVLPTITNIDNNMGSTAGGQLLTITGTSLDDPNATVLVDGSPCTIQTVSESTITCETTPKTL